MVREFVNRVFDGSARPLLVHLLKEKSLTDRERRELQKLLGQEEKSRSTSRTSPPIASSSPPWP